MSKNAMRCFYRTHDPVITMLSSELITKQEYKSECDINTIISQYKQTGIINHISSKSAQFIDLPSDFDYQSSLNVIMQAQDAFEALPSVVRDYYQNDPEAFLAAFGDPAQHDQLREWGLLKPKREPDPGAPAAAPAPGADSASQ